MESDVWNKLGQIVNLPNPYTMLNLVLIHNGRDKISLMKEARKLAIISTIYASMYNWKPSVIAHTIDHKIFGGPIFDPQCLRVLSSIPKMPKYTTFSSLVNKLKYPTSIDSPYIKHHNTPVYKKTKSPTSSSTKKCTKKTGKCSQQTKSTKRRRLSTSTSFRRNMNT